MATLVVGDLGVGLLGGEEPLLGDVAAMSALDLQSRVCLYVTVPVGFLPPSGDDDALLGGGIVPNHLQRRLPDAPALASPMGKQQKAVPHKPAEAVLVEMDRQLECGPEDAGRSRTDGLWRGSASHQILLWSDDKPLPPAGGRPGASGRNHSGPGGAASVYRQAGRRAVEDEGYRTSSAL